MTVSTPVLVGLGMHAESISTPPPDKSDSSTTRQQRGFKERRASLAQHDANRHTNLRRGVLVIVIFTNVITITSCILQLSVVSLFSSGAVGGGARDQGAKLLVTRRVDVGANIP